MVTNILAVGSATPCANIKKNHANIQENHVGRARPSANIQKNHVGRATPSANIKKRKRMYKKIQFLYRKCFGKANF